MALKDWKRDKRAKEIIYNSEDKGLMVSPTFGRKTKRHGEKFGKLYIKGYKVIVWEKPSRRDVVVRTFEKKSTAMSFAKKFMKTY